MDVRLGKHNLLWMTVAVATVFAPACSDDDEVRLGRRGESCRAANDCSDGLNCISSRCVQNDFPIAQTAQVCVRVECSDDSDCFEAQRPSGDCDSLLETCRMDPLSFECFEYLRDCAPNQECISERCIAFQPCFQDDDCPPSETCTNNRCAQPPCTMDSECGFDRICVNGNCQFGCTERSDCLYLHDCVNRECVPTGCTTDRECIALTTDPLSQCVTRDATPICITPCNFDNECGGPLSGCVEGVCTYLGCETDEECRIFLGITPGDSTQAICR